MLRFWAQYRKKILFICKFFHYPLFLFKLKPGIQNNFCYSSEATYNPYMAAAAGGSNFRSTSKTAVTNASYHLEMSLLQGYSKLAIPNQNNSNPFWIYTDVTLYQLLELVSQGVSLLTVFWLLFNSFLHTK